MDAEKVDFQIRRYLEHIGLLETNQETCWKIEPSKLSGRGVIAQRDIEANEQVYGDAALISGPRSYSKYLPMCATCCRRGVALFACDRRCGLPVCSNGCQDDPEHADRECAYLRGLEPLCCADDTGTGWSLELLMALVPVRGLLLPKPLRDICYHLQAHQLPRHSREIDMLIKNVKREVKPEDEEVMRRICCVMDTNSFESAVVHEDNPDDPTSLRALFPLGALTNHQCVPNTRHLVDPKGRLYVFAARPIAEGEEITMSYTELLWDTTMRRQFLRATKHFDCLCTRCADPLEFKSLLGALHCANVNCDGNVLPDAPLSFNTNWTCDKCGLVIKNKQISAIRSGILAAIEEVIYENPRKILRFIKRELSILIPEYHYLMMEMMFRIVSLFGRVAGVTWKELNDEELDIKIQYCEKLLKVLDKLNCGDCIKKGLILYELYCANVEKSKRISSKQENGDATTNEYILIEAMKLLKDDIAAPSDYRCTYALKSHE